jgi:hypothetical protein
VLNRLFILPLCLAGCARSGRDAAGSAGADSTRHFEVREVPAVAFRVPAGGGALGVYTLPKLDSTPWGAGSRIAGARTAVGVDLIGRRLLFRDSAGAIASFDLVALRQRTVSPRRVVATLAADGSLLAVDSSGGITESQPWGTRQWTGALGRGVRDVFAAPGARLTVIRRGRGEDTLQLAARETGIALTRAVPDAADRAASRDGDAIAFATDSGLVVFEDRDMDRPWFVRLPGKPRRVAFSPSGHRIFVALRERSELAVVDRFSRRERPAISLPDRAAALRPDPWGRVLLVRGEDDRADGETWVVSVARNRVVGRVRGSWASDLPTVAETGVVLARQGSAVVARDLGSLDSVAAVAGGARDLWFAGRWVPSSAAAAAKVDLAARPAAPRAEGLAAADRQPKSGERPPKPGDRPAAAEPRRPVVDSARNQPARTAAAVPKPPSGDRAAAAAFYVQLLATRSEDAARALATQLASYRAQVVAPRPGLGDENWRVLVGPFGTREAADSAGRTIGRAYWIADRSRDAARP